MFNINFTREIKNDLAHTIDLGLNEYGPVRIFFRADDIGVPSKNYNHMMELFLKYQTPLCLAVVPAWITNARWKAMDGFIKKGEKLFCWHMHGYRHKNHETQGKKQEFGPARPSSDLFHDLSKGYTKLCSIMGKKFTPVFTPPWNRCTKETLELLKKIGFKAVSASQGSFASMPYGLKEFSIHADLHTRKEKQKEQARQNLMKEFKQGMATKTLGIMIHHMRMNQQDSIFLEYLLETLNEYEKITIVTYDDLIQP